MRGAAKGIGEPLLIRSGIAAICRRRFGGRSIVLSYHNVLPDGSPPAGDSSLHIPRRRFCEQLDRLAKSHDVMALDALLDRTSLSPSVRPRAAITFDDAYRGAVTTGARELERRGMPATFFVSPGLLGGVYFWWDLLADPRTGTVPEAARFRSLERLSGKQELVLAEGASRPEETGLPPDAASATVEELGRMVARPGMTVASHSWDHPNLTRLSPDELAEQLEQSWSWLRARFDRAIPYLSYPYGLWNQTVETSARATGYRAALRIEGGWLPKRSEDRYALPRLNVARGLTPNGLELKLSGIGAGR